MTSSMSITGTACLINPMMGFASTYNPVALMCHAVDDADGNDGIRQCETADEINTALTGGLDEDSTDNAVMRARNRTENADGAVGH